MKKLIIPFMFIVCLIAAACSNNDEPKPELSGEYLEATTWDAELTGEAYPNHTPISAHFVMQFLTKESGKCVPAYGDDSYEGEFTYNITKEMITFNGSMVGNWTVMEQTNSKMVFQSFLPYKFVLVLNKM